MSKAKRFSRRWFPVVIKFTQERDQYQGDDVHNYQKFIVDIHMIILITNEEVIKESFLIILVSYDERKS